MSNLSFLAELNAKSQIAGGNGSLYVVQDVVNETIGPTTLARLDTLCTLHTGSKDFAGFMFAVLQGSSYRPSIYCTVQNPRSPKSHAEAAEKTQLADAYDDFMERIGDARRAFRG